ncbi:flagellar biosynthetic protein FliR [Altererythrobacter sp. Z27]|uniref:flagellar biosynthetic protein FliR n=1 Tax=Altererythrobacter sp. Z27 TaxID=3461147 RepID=UPI00404464F4
MADYIQFWLASLMVALRLAPAMAFAPPFTLFRIPATIRVLIAIGLSFWLVAARPELTADRIAGRNLIGLLFGEVAIGIAIALGLQIVFAAIAWAGQALDIQAGYGLAMIADPTTNAQIPLAGTILSYVAAMVFFTTGGHYDLLSLWVVSVETLPVGYGTLRPDITAIGAFMGAAFFIAVGLVGVSMLAIFLADIVIAFLSRTLPQMNVLLLGFQVKAIAMIITLPISIGLAGALFLRLVRLAVWAPSSYWGHAA